MRGHLAITPVPRVGFCHRDRHDIIIFSDRAVDGVAIAEDCVISVFHGGDLFRSGRDRWVIGRDGDMVRGHKGSDLLNVSICVSLIEFILGGAYLIVMLIGQRDEGSKGDSRRGDGAGEGS